MNMYDNTVYEKSMSRYASKIHIYVNYEFILPGAETFYLSFINNN